MTIDKIQFTEEKETMLMMLSGRAIQSQWKDPFCEILGLKKPCGISTTT